MSGIWHTSTFRQELAFLRGPDLSEFQENCAAYLQLHSEVLTEHSAIICEAHDTIKPPSKSCIYWLHHIERISFSFGGFIFLFFSLTQRLGGSVYVVYILRLRDHLLKSHRASRITVRVRAQTGLRLGSNPPVCIFDRRATASSQTLQLHSLLMTNVMRSTTVTGSLSPSTVWWGCLCMLFGRMSSFGIWRQFFALFSSLFSSTVLHCWIINFMYFNVCSLKFNHDH